MATTRDDDVMKGTTPTNSVNLGITTRCTMKCPNCSIDVPARAADKTATHARWSDIVVGWETLVKLEPLRRVHLTGGEPTMHPDFEGLVRYLQFERSRGNVRYLTIETNGSGCMKYADLFEEPALFDRVFITHYVKDKIYPGNYDNTEVIEWAKSAIGDRLISEKPVEHTRRHNQPDTTELSIRAVRKKPCTKFYDPGLPCGWYDGLLYPCCVSVGIDRTLGIPVTEDWRDKITKLDMGCDRCLYRGT